MCKWRAIGKPARLTKLKSNAPARRRVLRSDLTVNRNYENSKTDFTGRNFCCSHRRWRIKKIGMTSNHNSHEFSRRSFLKTTACLTLGSLAAGHSLAATFIEKGGIATPWHSPSIP